MAVELDTGDALELHELVRATPEQLRHLSAQVDACLVLEEFDAEWGGAPAAMGALPRDVRLALEAEFHTRVGEGEVADASELHQLAKQLVSEADEAQREARQRYLQRKDSLRQLKSGPADAASDPFGSLGKELVPLLANPFGDGAQLQLGGFGFLQRTASRPDRLSDEREAVRFERARGGGEHLGDADHGREKPKLIERAESGCITVDAMAVQHLASRKADFDDSVKGAIAALKAEPALMGRFARSSSTTYVVGSGPPELGRGASRPQLGRSASYLKLKPQSSRLGLLGGDEGGMPSPRGAYARSRGASAEGAPPPLLRASSSNVSLDEAGNPRKNGKLRRRLKKLAGLLGGGRARAAVNPAPAERTTAVTFAPAVEYQGSRARAVPDEPDDPRVLVGRPSFDPDDALLPKGEVVPSLNALCHTVDFATALPSSPGVSPGARSQSTLKVPSQTVLAPIAPPGPRLNRPVRKAPTLSALGAIPATTPAPAEAAGHAPAAAPQA